MEKRTRFKCSSKALLACLNKHLPKGCSKDLYKFCYEVLTGPNLTDSYGRTALHVAASCGHLTTVEWLINEVGLEMNLKDVESGWTALHRALFYGYLAEARCLITAGCSINIRDKEGLTAFDVTMKDRRLVDELNAFQFSLETFTWGENTNFTLGHRNSAARKNPELVELFKKEALFLSQVIVSKYHTVFLTLCGKVYTCGHGQGGRLGHDKAHTYLEPQHVKGMEKLKVSQIAASTDHTLMLATDGTVYGCGMNNHQQLGLGLDNEGTNLPVEVPGLESIKIKGIATQRFHSAVFSEKEVFTFGLNAGQLGQRKVAGETYIYKPKEVSTVMHLDPDARIEAVTCSVGTTVVHLSNGDLYALQNYRCNRILARWLNIEQLQVQGGELDQTVLPDNMKGERTGGLILAFINRLGQLFIWKKHFGAPRRVVYDIHRSLEVRSFCLGLFSVSMATTEGDAFIAALPDSLKIKSKETAIESSTSGKTAQKRVPKDCVNVFKKTPVIEVTLTRVPMIHRASFITMDRKARNFAVLQSHPSTALGMLPDVEPSMINIDLRKLLEEVHESDVVHDVILQIGTRRIPAHRYILASKSEFFKNMFSGKSNEHCTIDLKVKNADVFMQLLTFLYTHTCDLLEPGKKVNIKTLGHAVDDPVEIDVLGRGHARDNKLTQNSNEKDTKTTSAYQVYHEGRAVRHDDKKEKEADTPLSLLESMATQFGVKALKDITQRLLWDESKSASKLRKGKHVSSEPCVTFDRHALLHLSDIALVCDQKMLIQAHRCILVARMEYFYSMLACDWLESGSQRELNMPINGDLMELVLDYVYTDSCQQLESASLDQLCGLLMLSDQLLIPRLQQMCEQACIQHVSLKTCGELLELAQVCHARQLMAICQRFICLNVAALLEGRHLDILSSETLQEVSRCYREEFGGFEYKRSIDGVEHFKETMEELRELYVESLTLETPETKKGPSRGRRKRTQGSFTEESGTRGGKTSTSSDHGPSGAIQLKIEGIQAKPELQVQTTLAEKMSISVTSREETRTSEGKSTARSRDETVSVSWTSPALYSPLTSPAPSSPRTPPAPSSPRTPPPAKASLKDIMQEQSSAKTPKQTPIFSGKKLKKVSQKEKKKLLHEAPGEEEQNTEAESTPVSPNPPKTNPWGSLTLPVAVPALVEVMENQQGRIQHPALVKTLEPARIRKKSQTEDKSPPWKSLPAVSAQTKIVEPQPGTLKEIPSFSQIMADEETLLDATARLANRPLGMSQAEDRAIQELYESYSSKVKDQNVRITVERVSKPVAAPTWTGRPASWSKP